MAHTIMTIGANDHRNAVIDVGKLRNGAGEIQMGSDGRFGNKVLSSLAHDDIELLLPLLEKFELPVRLQLEAPGQPIESVIFPEQGIISVIAVGRKNRIVEVGIIGCEGLSGSAVVMGADRSPHQTIVQVSGHGWRIRSEALRKAMDSSRSLTLHLQRATHVFGVQTAHTALGNSKGKVEQRLARWLLMAHDRLRAQDALHLTHDFLSIMLGVRRPGVTDALANLEGQGLIRSRRVNITILDRAGLERAADGLYGIPEQEYARLFGGTEKVTA